MKFTVNQKNLIRYFEQFHRYCRDDLNFDRIEKPIHHLIMVKMNLTWTFTQFCGAVLACLCIIFLRDVSKVVFLYLFFQYSLLSLFDQHDLSDNLKPILDIRLVIEMVADYEMRLNDMENNFCRNLTIH